MNKIQTATSNLIQTKVGLINQDWNIVPIGKVIKLSQYGLSISTDKNGTIPILGMKHLVEGKVKIDNLSYVSINEEEKDKFCLKKGDLLLNRTNSYELVGKVALFNHNDKLIVFASYLVRFQFDTNKVLPEFVNFFLNSYPAQHYLKRLATKGVSQVNINPSVFRKLFLLPIPPLEEQRKIAEILSTWNKAIALAEKLIAAKQKLKKGLRQKLFNLPDGKKKEFAEFTELVKDKFNPKKNEESCVCVELEHIEQGTGKLLGHTYSKEQNSTKTIFKSDDVLFGKLRPYLKKYANPNFNGVCSTEIWVLRAKSYLCNNKYLFQLIQTDSFLSVSNKTSGSKMPRSDWSIVSEYPFILPSLEKQKEIADLLDLIDKDFHLFNLLKYRLNKQKRGLMQKLLTGEWRVSRWM